MATAIIIVSFKNQLDITECLAAISGQTGSGDLGVFVVENGGTAAFDALVEALAAPGGPCIEAASSKLANLASPGGRHLRCVVLVTCRGYWPVVVAEAPENLGYGGGINSWLERLWPYPEWDGFSGSSTLIQDRNQWLCPPSKPRASCSSAAWQAARWLTSNTAIMCIHAVCVGGGGAAMLSSLTMASTLVTQRPLEVPGN